ncbi:ATP-dependent DNA helicase, partial [Durusdinium trenchii]
NLVNSPSNNPGATSEPSNGLAAEAETVSATVGADATNPASQHPSAASQPGSSNAAATDVEMAGSNLEPETNRANVAEDDGVWKPFETEAEENIGSDEDGNTRPNICSQDYSNRQYQDPDIDLVARVAQATDNIVVDTGHTFWDQWRTDFLHWAFPFSLPAPVGGPDFPQAPRPRRGPSAARFNPLTHLKHLAGRVESSIRNSWDLVPGLRRITFKWHSVWGGSLWRRWQHNRHKLEAVPQSEWVQAAQRLYNKLQSGTYLSADGLARPIAYDARKLHFAKGLTAPEKQLLDDIRNMQTSMPGSIEVRRRIGRFLFGARVEFGEPLFITVSPSTRHNGLTLRLSRYRQKDPGSTPWSGQDQPP